MIKFQESKVINRPVEAVFAYATDPKNMRLWQTENVVAEKSLAEGKQLRTVKGLGVKAGFVCETPELIPNQKIASRVTGGGKLGRLCATGFWKFDPVDQSTRVTMGWEVELAGLLKLAAPVFAPLARRTVSRDLANLKKALE